MEYLHRLIPDERSTHGFALPAAASATWVIGLAAMLCDVFQSPEPLIIATRTAFAAATCATLCLALLPRNRQARLVSRWTYILIYSLALVRIALYLYCAGHLNVLRPLEDFQFYLIASVVPLWVIRAVVLSRS